MKKLFVAALTFVLASCATYQDVWTPPSTEQGMSCVANCGSQRQNCQFQQQSLNVLNQSVAQQCQADYQRAMQSYQVCLAQYPAGRCTQWTERTVRDGTGREKREQVCSSQTYVSPCVQPTPCNVQKTDNAQCDSAYKSCFLSCGGRFDRVEVK